MCKPLFTCPGHVRRHRFVSFVWVSIRFSILSVVVSHEIHLASDIEMMGVTSVAEVRFTPLSLVRRWGPPKGVPPAPLTGGPFAPHRPPPHSIGPPRVPRCSPL